MFKQWGKANEGPQRFTKAYVWASRAGFQLLLTVTLAFSEYLPSQNLVLSPEILVNTGTRVGTRPSRFTSFVLISAIIYSNWNNTENGPWIGTTWKFMKNQSTYVTVSGVLWHSRLTIDDDNIVNISKKLKKLNDLRRYGCGTWLENYIIHILYQNGTTWICII